MIGAGSAMAVAGGAYDFFSPTSNDERFSSEDLISVGLIGVGIAVGVGGLVVVMSDPGDG